MKSLNSQNHHAYNFNAGPAAIPLPVLEKAQREFINFQQSGMSVMELSHRSDLYETIHNKAIEKLRALFDIPNDYTVLFLQGGASTQFATIPMNFLTADKKAGYVMTGSWAEKALKETVHFGSAYELASSQAASYRHIPDFPAFENFQNDAYVHLTSNNTIYGTQWKTFPHTKNVPLIADMSSDIMSRQIDVSQFDLIYAGAQKNLGPSGVTTVIVKNSFLNKNNRNIPTMFDYQTHADKNSLFNTPPTFSIYILSEVLQWIEDEGGLDLIAKRNEQKAQLIYDAIDSSQGFYKGYADPLSRSLMNITFNLPTRELEQTFLKEAKDNGFVGLNGHRSIGGCRASCYNAVPLETCKALRDFMKTFQAKHSN